MVLQRSPLQASIWGWADAGDTVSAALTGPTSQTVSAQADTNGAWKITFAAVDAGGPYTIAVSTGAGDKASLDNLLFGDVYWCGGQSNMQFTVDLAFNATEEIQLAANYPNIRVFTVGTNNISSEPLEELASFIQPWSVANSQSIGGSPWAEFSAVCWFFGRDLYDTYKVPIGLINSNWGGTYIQAWSSPAALAKCPSADLPPISKVNINAPNPNQPSIEPAVPEQGGFKSTVQQWGTDFAKDQARDYAIGKAAEIAAKTALGARMLFITRWFFIAEWGSLAVAVLFAVLGNARERK